MFDRILCKPRTGCPFHGHIVLRSSWIDLLFCFLLKTPFVVDNLSVSPPAPHKTKQSLPWSSLRKAHRVKGVDGGNRIDGDVMRRGSGSTPTWRVKRNRSSTPGIQIIARSVQISVMSSITNTHRCLRSGRVPAKKKSHHL